MLRSLIGVAALLAACPAAAGEPTVVEQSGRDITLGQLALIPQEFDHLAGRVVAQISPTRTTLELDGEAIRSILRREAPLLGLVPRIDGNVLLVLAVRDQGERADQGACHQLAIPVATGDYLDSDTLAPAACETTSEGRLALAYDRRVGAVRATADLAAGTYVGRVIASQTPVVPEASQVVLRSASGPVAVERDAQTLQPGIPGERVFVRTADGTVLSVAMAKEQP